MSGKQKTGAGKANKTKGTNKVGRSYPDKYERVRRRVEKAIETLSDELVSNSALGEVEKAKMRAQIEILDEVFSKKK